MSLLETQDMLRPVYCRRQCQL